MGRSEISRKPARTDGYDLTHSSTALSAGSSPSRMMATTILFQDASPLMPPKPSSSSRLLGRRNSDHLALTMSLMLVWIPNKVRCDNNARFRFSV